MPLRQHPKIRVALVIAAGFLAGGLTYLAWHAMQPPVENPATVSHFQPAAHSPFQLRKQTTVLGYRVSRLSSRTLPQEFLVLEHVSPLLVKAAFAKPVNPAFATMVANRLLALGNRASADDESAIGEKAGPKLSVDVQDVRTTQTGTLAVDGHPLPYWQVQVRFKLSTEDAPRTYDAAAVHMKAPGRKEETLIVSFARTSVFEKSEMVAFCGNLAEPREN